MIQEVLSMAKEIESDNQIKKPGAGSLLTFTLIYSLSIYILLLSFYFWLVRTDIKPEE